MNKSACLLIIVCLLGRLQGSAQPKCKLEFFTPEQGLSHQAVTGMLKDREGFMWFCSWDGLNRFDGQKFVHFKSAPGDHSQLGSDRLDLVMEDSQGDLWIEAYDRQIYRFEKSRNQFIPLAPLLQKYFNRQVNFTRLLGNFDHQVWLQSDEDGIIVVPERSTASSTLYHYSSSAASAFKLPSNNIRFFYQDSLHRFWIGTDKGLSCLEKKGEVFERLQANYTNETGVFTAASEDERYNYFSKASGELIAIDKNTGTVLRSVISKDRINALHFSRSKHQLFACTQTGELIIVKPGTWQTQLREFPGEALLDLFEDSKGRIWIEPGQKGVLMFDEANKKSNNFKNNLSEGLNSVGIRFRFLEDKNGHIWVNMKAGGFGYYNEAANRIDYAVSTTETVEQSLPTFVYNIIYDSTGIIWFTTNERQLVKMVLQDNYINQKVLVPHARNRWDNEVRGICYDRLNRLWAGAKSGKLYVFEGEQQLDQIFDNLPAEGLGLIYAILPDYRGNVWLGTKANGLFKAVPVNAAQTRYHLQHFSQDTGARFGLNCNEIYGLQEDGPGRIWIGSFDAGLSLLVDDEQGTRFYHRGNIFKSLPSSFKKIRNLAMDAQGRLWIASTGGLLVMDPGKKKKGVFVTQTYTKQPGNAASLGNNDIQYIFRDANDNMWLGTSGGGLCRAFIGHANDLLRFRNYTSRDGLPNDYILSISQDKEGDIWMATENGLSRFDQKTKKFRNYDSYDGFPRGNFSESAIDRHPVNGSLVFGNTKGIILFDPHHIQKNQFPAQLAFTHLEINNNMAGPGQSMPLEKDINYLDQLRLRYNQNIISIDYAVLDNRTGMHEPAEYRLIGFDNSWHKDRNLRRATYTNLPPGTYEFEVRAGNTDSYSNQLYRKLAIEILPPPWKTWWAYLLYAITLLVIFLMLRRNALTMIRLRHKIVLEQKLAVVKANFFTQVSHELRTPLTLIQSPIDQLLRKETLSFEGRSYAELARKNANRMLRFVNQLLDFRKVETDKAAMHYSVVEVVGFTRRICDHFEEAASVKKINLEVNSTEKQIDAWLDAEKFDVVLYNILGNAVKFTPGGKSIRVNMSKQSGDGLLLISVQDQGPGVSREELLHIFDLFYEGEHPGAREQKGSGIGLALSSEFIKLHDGKIWAENAADGGLIVFIELKLEKPDAAIEGEIWVDDAGHLIETPVEQKVLQQVSRPSTSNRQSELVLLVEDNDELRDFLQQQLAEFFRVEVAGNGEIGCRKAIELEPDLVISDVMMPVMSGIEMLDRLRNDPATSHIPVVLLTARSSIESQIEGMKYGADFYITKPFNLEHLVVSVNNLIKQRKRLFESLMRQKSKQQFSPEPVIVTSRDEIFLKDVIKMVEEKLPEADFSLESLATQMAMSRSTFSKKFKSLTGMTTVEFVRDMRLQKSRQLLDAGWQVAEVAYAVGFSNPKYFSTCFREKYDMAPSDYQRSRHLD